MSDVFFERSDSMADQEAKPRPVKLDAFSVARFSYYVTDNDDEVGNRDLPESPTQPDKPKKAAKGAKRSVKIENSADDRKMKSAKGKTPVKPTADTGKTPDRKSPRIAGSKRKALESEPEAADDTPSPLAKKSKTTDATADGLVTASCTSTAPQARPEAAATSSNPKPEKAQAVKLKPAAVAPKTTAGSSRKRARSPEEDYNGDSDVESERPTKAKKVKKSKSAKEVEGLKDFESAANKASKDSTPQRPEGATLDVPWKCGNRQCKTGMTWLKRGDGTERSNGYGRKACSHFFGRNKKETGYIHLEVWHWMCRKCYQRRTYKARKPSDGAHNKLVKEHIDRLRHQIIRLQIWRPNMIFKVQLNKAAKSRLADYHKALAKIGVTEADAAESVKFAGGKNAKGNDKKPRIEHEFPIQGLNYFDDAFAGEGKTYSDLVDICDWVDELNEADNAPCDPPIEFLPNLPVKGEPIIDPIGPPDNYDRWVQYCDAEALRLDGVGTGECAVKAGAVGNEKKTKIEDTAVEAPAAEDEKKTDADEATDAENAEEAADPGSNEDQEDEEDDDAAETSRLAPAKYGGFLKTTPLGKKLGLTGKAGIFYGTGIRAEREREEAERLADQRKIESASASLVASEVDIKAEQ